MKKKRPMPQQVLDADDLVVGAEAEVAADALGLLLAQRRRVAAQPRPRVVAEAEPDQEPDDAEDVAEEDRDVVLVGVAEVLDARAVDVVADEPAEVVADDPEHDRGEELKPSRRRQSGGRIDCGALTCSSRSSGALLRVGEVASSRTAAGTS